MSSHQLDVANMLSGCAPRMHALGDQVPDLACAEAQAERYVAKGDNGKFGVELLGDEEEGEAVGEGRWDG